MPWQGVGRNPTVSNAGGAGALEDRVTGNDLVILQVVLQPRARPGSGLVVAVLLQPERNPEVRLELASDTLQPEMELPELLQAELHGRQLPVLIVERVAPLVLGLLQVLFEFLVEALAGRSQLRQFSPQCFQVLLANHNGLLDLALHSGVHLAKQKGLANSLLPDSKYYLNF